MTDAERHITDDDRKCPNQENSSRDASINPNNDLKPLTEGTVVGKSWVVKEKIEGEMGFYNIYIVEHNAKKTKGALKLEQKNAKIPLLKFELFILLQMEQKNKSKQFCRVFDRGQEAGYNWMVTTLCGKNLKTLRKETPEGKLSLGCGLSVSLQCLRAIEELHKVGFIHRAVNPTDFAIGRISGDDTKELRNVYILDFGFAHQYRNPDGTHKPPRQNPWKYMGSVRHASRNAFLQRELSRLDDLEMWFYMTIELVKGSLPWVAYREPKDVFEYQKKVRQGLGLRELLGGLPVEFGTILKEVDKLGYKDDPPYSDIYGLIANAIAKSPTKEYPYDWEAAEIEAAKAPPAAPAAAAASTMSAAPGAPPPKTAAPLPPTEEKK